MGYQQKLIYISALIISGVAIAIGLQKYESSSREAYVTALKLDLLDIAVRAQLYYAKPKCLEGGGKSFSGLATDSNGLKKLFVEPENINGSFKIIPSGHDEFIFIQAIGNDDYDGDGQNITIEAKVYPDKVEIVIVNY